MAATTYPTYGSTDDNNWYSDPANAPPNTTWDPATGTWKSTSPTATPSTGYDGATPWTGAPPQYQPQIPGPSTTLPGSTTTPPPTAPPSSSGLTAPSGGSVNDPSYVDKLLAYYATQPGVNPSVINDPNYWRQAAASGRFNGDTDYFIKRLMTPEGAPESGGASGGGAGGTNMTLTSGLQNSPQGQQLYDLLMKRANQGLNVDPNDPIIRQQTDAYSADQQRAERHYLSGLAEKAGDNGNITAETRHAAEVEGQNTGAFEGQLMANEIAARRQEIQAALSGATGFLTDSMRLQLQEELGKLQLAENHYQFGQNMDEKKREFNSDDDYRWIFPPK